MKQEKKKAQEKKEKPEMGSVHSDNVEMEEEKKVSSTKKLYVEAEEEGFTGPPENWFDE